MLRQKLQEEQIAALKSGDKVRLEVLRFIISQIKNKEIDTKTELNDEQVIDVIRKHVKQLKESIDAFQKGNRPDLEQETQVQYDIVASYLPKELSDEELKAEIQKLIAANQEVFNANPKAMIGICMKELRSKADSGRIMAILQSLT